MSADVSRVFSIPVDMPFLDVLAENILAGKIIVEWPEKNDPLSLCRGTIILPTRRSAESLKKIFLSKYKITFVPKILTLGELDFSENVEEIQPNAIDLGEQLFAYKKMSLLRRKLYLTNLIKFWAHQIEHSHTYYSHNDESTEFATEKFLREFSIVNSLSGALGLASSLEHLIDTLAIHDRSWSDLEQLSPPGDVDEYWQLAKQFLRIVAEFWPKYCEAQGALDAIAYQKMLIKRYSNLLESNSLIGPIIIAGSTGSIPATTALVKLIALRNNGAVVLSGLDKNMDSGDWKEIQRNSLTQQLLTHPQSQFAKLLMNLQIERESIEELGTRKLNGLTKNKFLSEVMRPFNSTEFWSEGLKLVSDIECETVLKNLSIIEAKNEQEEALAISVCVKEVLEKTNNTIDIITPDRSIARRVKSELRRWNLSVEDSFGEKPIYSTMGQLLVSILNVMINDFSPINIYSMLINEHFSLGIPTSHLSKARSIIDYNILRSPLKNAGTSAIADELNCLIESSSDPEKFKSSIKFSRNELINARILVERLNYILISFTSHDNIELDYFSMLIWRSLVLITALPGDSERLFQLDGSLEIDALIKEISEAKDIIVSDTLNNIARFLKELIASRTIYRKKNINPRIRILGLLEARLLRSETTILAGLDEHIWPVESQSDPFLNRAWRKALRLPLPEQKVGQNAHDFVSAICAETVIISRAVKRNGTPTIPSRFLQRLRALSPDVVFNDAICRGRRYLDLSRCLNYSKQSIIIKRPMPIVDWSILPSRLNVTEVEMLRRDPYSIYAKYVLKFVPLDRVGYKLGARERGNYVHLALARYSLRWPFEISLEPLQELIRIGDEILRNYKCEFNDLSIWRHNFIKSAKWFVEWDSQRRQYLVAPLVIERSGEYRFRLSNGNEFLMTARADRIEILDQNLISIFDFKTGKIPTLAQVMAGFSPQLILEALIAIEGGFKGVSAASISSLEYIKFGGKGGGESNPVFGREMTKEIIDLAERQFSELCRLIDSHWVKARPFYSRPHVQFLSERSSYDHFARVPEWSNVGIDDGIDGE
jgi:ATP-dependent helicase/nuclease subunit B